MTPNDTPNDRQWIHQTDSQTYHHTLITNVNNIYHQRQTTFITTVTQHQYITQSQSQHTIQNHLITSPIPQYHRHHNHHTYTQSYIIRDHIIITPTSQYRRHHNNHTSTQQLRSQPQTQTTPENQRTLSKPRTSSLRLHIISRRICTISI